MQSSDERICEVCGVILSYDGSREPKQRKYDRKFIWSGIKRWTRANYPQKSLREVYDALVVFNLKQEAGYYYLAPIGQGMHPMSTTGLGWDTSDGTRWHTYPDELEEHAHELTSVEIIGLTPDVIRFDSYDRFSKEIGLENVA